MPKIKLNQEVFDLAVRVAQMAGYSCVEEFITHAIDKELSRLEAQTSQSKESENQLQQRLRGLGYIE